MAIAQRHLKKTIFIFHSDPIHIPIDLFCRCGRKWKDKLKFLFPIWLRLAEFFLLFRQLNAHLVGEGVGKYWPSDFPFNSLNVPFWYKSKATSLMYLENTIPSFVNTYLFLMIKSWFLIFFFFNILFLSKILLSILLIELLSCFPSVCKTVELLQCSLFAEGRADWADKI